MLLQMKLAAIMGLDMLLRAYSASLGISSQACMKLVGLAQGVRDGGRMNLSIRKIDVTAPYQVIPEHLDIDVTALKIGKSIKVGDLSFEGLELATSKAVVVCSIKMTRNAAAAAAAAATEEEEA